MSDPNTRRSRLRIQAGRLLRPVFDRTFVEDSASVIMVALLYRTVPQVFDEKFWSDLKLPGSLRPLRTKIDGFKLSMRRGEYVLPAELDDIVLAVPDLFHEQFAALMELLHRYTATLKTLQRLGSQATREVNEQDSIDFAGFDRQMARAAKELADKMRASSLPEVSARAVRMINDLLDLLREVVAGLKSLGGTEAAFLSEVEEDDAVVEFLVNRLGESVRDRIVLALLYESAICALAELPQDGEAGEEYLLETGTAFYQLVEQYNLMYPASRQVGPFVGLRVVLSVSASSGGGGATATAEVHISQQINAPGGTVSGATQMATGVRRVDTGGGDYVVGNQDKRRGTFVTGDQLSGIPGVDPTTLAAAIAAAAGPRIQATNYAGRDMIIGAGASAHATGSGTSGAAVFPDFPWSIYNTRGLDGDTIMTPTVVAGGTLDSCTITGNGVVFFTGLSLDSCTGSGGLVYLCRPGVRVESCEYLTIRYAEGCQPVTDSNVGCDIRPMTSAQIRQELRRLMGQ